MNKSNNSIGIYFSGLEAKERSIFNRVIAFNITHGLESHTSEDITSSDLIISTETSFSQVSHELQNQKVLIISDNTDCTLGNVQLNRPILITRVMKALEKTVDLVKLEKEPLNNNIFKINNIVEKHNTEESKEIETINKTSEKEVSTEDTSNDQSIENHSGHHALVIDDSAAIRKQLELELRDAGISADFAESGEQALEKIEDTQYDLVFLDIIMPGIDGYETCRAMRAKASYKKTPIIMLSGKTSPLDEVQGVIAGATTYLTKPVKSKMLQETLSRVTKWIDNFATPDKKKDSATV